MEQKNNIKISERNEDMKKTLKERMHEYKAREIFGLVFKIIIAFVGVLLLVNNRGAGLISFDKNETTRILVEIIYYLLLIPVCCSFVFDLFQLLFSLINEERRAFNGISFLCSFVILGCAVYLH